MKLSLKMISERLDSSFQVLKFRDIYGTVRLGRPVFLTDETLLRANTLYLCKGDQFCDDFTYESGAALIILKEPQSPIHNCPALIVINVPDCKDSSIMMLSNAVNQIFNFFDNWERQLNNIILHYDHFKAFSLILKASEDVFENEITISDSAFNILTSDNLEGISLKELEHVKHGAYYHMLMNEHDIFTVHDELFPHRIMIKNIFFEDRLFYRLAITESNRHFRETDYLFLEILSEYINEIISGGQNHVDTNISSLSKVLLSLITLGHCNQALLRDELSMIGFEITDTYRIVVSASNEQNFLISTMSYYSENISKENPGIFAFGYQSYLLMLADIDKLDKEARLNDKDNPAARNNLSEEADQHSNLQQLTSFLDTNRLHAGISNLFTNISELHTYFRQAEIAYNTGVREFPERTVSFFSDCVLYYMLDAASEEFDQKELLSPVYVRLKEYDQHNSTEYLKTLLEYMRQHQNAVQTAQALYIHRATMIYRIKRICEIGRTDLKEPDELLHLALSFKIDHKGNY